MDFYLACVRRQACLRGKDKTLLSKNPWFTGKVANLVRCFPDCRIVYLVRNPFDVIGSAVNLGRTILCATAGKEAPPQFIRRTYDLLKFYYLYPLEQLRTLPGDRVRDRQLR